MKTIERNQRSSIFIAGLNIFTHLPGTFLWRNLSMFWPTGQPLAEQINGLVSISDMRLGRGSAKIPQIFLCNFK